MAGHDRITPEGKKFFQQIKELKKLQVRIGFQAGKDTDANGVDLTDVAMWNELGTVNSPSRPFMRKSVDENTPKINAFCKRQIDRIKKGATAQSVLEEIGVMQKGLIQEKIVSGDFVPNAPSTIRKKKSDKPLIDTGRMRQSVNYIITKKGGD